MIKLIHALIDLLFPPRCYTCRRVGEEVLCKKCLESIRASGFIYSVGVYEGTLRKAIQLLKFKKKKDLAQPLGDLMNQYLEKQKWRFDLIVPVPLHKKRLKERGFNQCELLGRIISNYTKAPVISDALVRIKETRPQFELKIEERINNVKGAFGVSDSARVKGKSILLIDDIYTTGATVKECLKVLKESGVREAKVLTLSEAKET